MTEPAAGEPGPAGAPAPAPEPTMRVERPPVPGRAARAEMADGSRATPPIRNDDPTETVAAPGPPARDRQRTLEFGAPRSVKVTVGPRPRRRHRTWPWIVAVVLALVVVGVTLLVMLLRGQTLDGGAGVLGAGAPAVVVLAPEVGGV